MSCLKALSCCRCDVEGRDGYVQPSVAVNVIYLHSSLYLCVGVESRGLLIKLLKVVNLWSFDFSVW